MARGKRHVMVHCWSGHKVRLVREFDYYTGEYIFLLEIVDSDGKVIDKDEIYIEQVVKLMKYLIGFIEFYANG